MAPNKLLRQAGNWSEGPNIPRFARLDTSEREGLLEECHWFWITREVMRGGEIFDNLACSLLKPCQLARLFVLAATFALTQTRSLPLLPFVLLLQPPLPMPLMMVLERLEERSHLIARRVPMACAAAAATAVHRKGAQQHLLARCQLGFAGHQTKLGSLVFEGNSPETTKTTTTTATTIQRTHPSLAYGRCASREAVKRAIAHNRQSINRLESLISNKVSENPPKFTTCCLNCPLCLATASWRHRPCLNTNRINFVERFG